MRSLIPCSGVMLFQQLAEASKYEIFIILDGVFVIPGATANTLIRRYVSPLGAYQSKESPYYPWYTFQNHPDDYESWGALKPCPKQMTNPSFMDYILTP